MDSYYNYNFQLSCKPKGPIFIKMNHVSLVNPYYQKSPADDREANSTQFSCKSSGYFADSNDCSRFYECIFSL